MKTIYIHCDEQADVWTADFRDADNPESVRELFGSTVIPTSYRAGAYGSSVALCLKERNPGHRIIEE